MLSEKEYLFLCEFAGLGIIKRRTGSIAEIAGAFPESNRLENSTAVKAQAENLKISRLKLSGFFVFKAVAAYLFEDDVDRTFVVVVKEEAHNNSAKEYQDSLVEYIRGNKGPGKCVVTGYGLAGLYASRAAAELGIEGIVFRAPCEEKLSGNIRNYVVENDPVCGHAEKVIFIKQKSEDMNMDEPLSRIALFEENGKAVIGKQSEYSKFCSWFYGTVGNIDNEIWNIFFKDKNEKDFYIDKSIYSIYLKAGELNFQGIKSSMKNTVKYIENELEKNIKKMKLEFGKNIFHMEGMDFEEQICEIAEKAAKEGIQRVKDIYNSVETVLMGIELFTVGRGSLDTESLMEQFSEAVDAILEKEIERMTGILKEEPESCMELSSVFPYIVPE